MNQEIVHSLVLQGNLRLLSKDTEACFVVGRQDRLSQNFFQTQEPTCCLESEPPLCKVCLVTIKDRNLFHDASIHDGTKLREVLTDRRRLACLGLMNLLLLHLLLQLIQLGLLTRDKYSQLFQIFHGSTMLRYHATKRNHKQNVM